MDVLISIDYEVSGNANGDPRQQIIRPTDDLLRLMDKLGLVATFFVEVEELRAFQKWRPRTFLAIKQQLDCIVAQGHEIALHLHPQWRNAMFSARDKTFTLSPSRSWILGADDKDQALVDYIQSRRQMLNSWVNASKNCSTISGFRAGGYSCSNYDLMLDALIEIGFLYDASPLIGSTRRGTYCEYDYTNFAGPACVGREFCLLPVSSWQSSKLYNFSPQTLFRGGQSLSSQGRQDLRDGGVFKSLKKIIDMETRALDWTTSNQRHFRTKLHTSANDPYLSVIGHTKTAVNVRSLERKLRIIRDYSDRVATHLDYARMSISRDI